MKIKYKYKYSFYDCERRRNAKPHKQNIDINILSLIVDVGKIDLIAKTKY